MRGESLPHHSPVPFLQHPPAPREGGRELSPLGALGAAFSLQCSATCGVGAIWRSVRCSTGTERHCAAASKPVPARRCSLRPCSSWRVGNWSKVSRRACPASPSTPSPFLTHRKGQQLVPAVRVVNRCPCVLRPRGLQKQRSDLALGTEIK